MTTVTGAAVDLPESQVHRQRRLVVIAAESDAESDGIRDYTSRLLEQLDNHSEWAGDLRLRGRRGGWVAEHDVTPPGAADAVIVQYNPFWYGHRGFAPSLPLALWRMRLSGSKRPTIALMAHETYVDMKNWRWVLMGGWQRLQMRLLQSACDVQFCSIDAWVQRLGRDWPYARAYHLPVGSNFPDMRPSRDEQRQALGADDSTIVLACFGLAHAGRLRAHVMSAAEAVVATGRRTVLVDIGAGPASLDGCPDGVELRAPGYLPEPELAKLVSAVDIFLAPYEDGISTRRGTMMSALQHSVAVVGTDGKFTDPVLREAVDAVALTPVDDVEAFATCVRDLAGDSRRRMALGENGRRLYEEHFDWPVITDRMLAVLDEARIAR